jgi:hypothetical protein
VYTRVEESRAVRAGVNRRELAPLDLQQLATVGVHVVNVLRQILSFA